MYERYSWDTDRVVEVNCTQDYLKLFKERYSNVSFDDSYALKCWDTPFNKNKFTTDIQFHIKSDASDLEAFGNSINEFFYLGFYISVNNKPEFLMEDMTSRHILNLGVNITQTNDGLFFDNIKENVTIYTVDDSNLEYKYKYFSIKFGGQTFVTKINIFWDKILVVISKAMSISIIFFHAISPFVNSCNEYYYLLELQENFNLSDLNVPVELNLFGYLLNLISFGWVYAEIGDFFDSIKAKLSFEEVSKIYEEESKNNNNTHDSNGLSKFLKKIDYLGENFTLYTYQNSKTTSTGGKISSVVLIFIIAGLGSILIIDYFRKEFPIITSYTDNLNNYKSSDFDETLISKKDVLIAGHLDYENEAGNMPSYHIKELFEPLEKSKCNDKDISSFNVQKNSSLNYYCYNSFEFQKMAKEKEFSFVSIALKIYFEVHFKMSNYNISDNDSHNTIKKDKDIHTEIMDTKGMIMYNNFYLIINEDRNLIKEEVKTIDIISNFNNFDNFPVYYFNNIWPFTPDNNVYIVEYKYEKIQNLINECIIVFKMAFIMMKFFATFFRKQ